MRKLIIISTCFCISFASIIEVKRAPIVVTLNNITKELSVGDKLTLKVNDKICISSGRGKFIIDDSIIVSSKSRIKCYTEGTNSSSTTIASKAMEYLDSSEDNVAGMSRSVDVK